MEANKFIAYSEASKKALKSATILKSLKINVLIEGEKGVGKLPLALEIAPKAPIVDGAKESSLFSFLEGLSDGDSVIIKNFHYTSNLIKLFQLQEKFKFRVIAVSDEKTNKKFINEFFSLVIYLPPLSQREEDVKPLAKIYFQEAKRDLDIECEEEEFFENFVPDISDNARSLKKSVYRYLLMQNFNETDIMRILEKYFETHLNGEDDYRKFLHIYELPLIRAGLKKYGSQLKLSKILGLNRNTLRKKIQELEKFLEKDEIK